MKAFFFLLCLTAALYFGYKKLNPTLPPDDVVNRDHYTLQVSNGASASNVAQPAIGQWHDSVHGQSDRTRRLDVPFQIRVTGFKAVRLAPAAWDYKGRTVKGYPVDVTMTLEHAYDMSKIQKPEAFRDMIQKVTKDLPRAETIEKHVIYFRDDDGTTWRYEPRKT